VLPRHRSLGSATPFGGVLRSCLVANRLRLGARISGSCARECVARWTLLRRVRIKSSEDSLAAKGGKEYSPQSVKNPQNSSLALFLCNSSLFILYRLRAQIIVLVR